MGAETKDLCAKLREAVAFLDQPSPPTLSAPDVPPSHLMRSAAIELENLSALWVAETRENERIRNHNAALVETVRASLCPYNGRSTGVTVGECQQCGCTSGLLIKDASASGSATFTAEECYQFFIAIDDRNRAFAGMIPEVKALREKLLPFYRDWHAAHPHQAHPSALRAAAIPSPSEGGAAT